MITKIFSVFDSKTQAFLPPFYAITRGSAIRSFTDALSDPNHAFARHAADYCLFELGSFDDASGTFVDLNVPPVSLGLAQEFLVA